MIQLAMIGVFGFLAATLIALALLPVVSRRARRLATARLERRMPMSMPAIAAERDQLRAAHAVEIRQMEQRMEGFAARHAVLMSDNGRQSARLIVLAEQTRADAATMAAHEADLATLRKSFVEAEATIGGQNVALNDAVAVADRHRAMQDADAARNAGAERLIADQRAALTAAEARIEDQRGIIASAETLIADQRARLAAAEQRAADISARVAAADALITEQRTHLESFEARGAEQRTRLAELEARITVTPAPPPMPAPAAAPAPAPIPVPETSPVPGEEALPLRALLSRHKAEQEMTRRGLVAATDERDRLRLRVDELLLRVEELQEAVEEAAERAEQDQRHAARQEKAIGALKARIAERDESLAAVTHELAEARSRHLDLRADGQPAAGSAPRDAAALREAIASLSADLVRYAVAPNGADGERVDERSS